MFVRWQRRQRNTPTYADGKAFIDTHYNAVLCSSFRDKDGKPQSTHVANLGGITAYGIDELWPRFHFWQSALKAMKDAKLDKADRDKITASLAKRVKPLTDKQTADCKKSRANLGIITAE